MDDTGIAAALVEANLCFLFKNGDFRSGIGRRDLVSCCQTEDSTSGDNHVSAHVVTFN